MIKTVIFDLGKVIVPFDFSRGYRAMEALCPYPAADIPKRIGTCDLVSRFERGLVPAEDFVTELCGLLEMKADYGRFCEIWSSIFLPDTLIPESLLEGLRKKFRLILLSNTNAIHFEMIQQNYPLLRHFDDLVLSYQVGAVKPSPRIYQEAIARAECKPAECFYTDDIAEYVEAGKREGLDAVQFLDSAQLQRELHARGVTWE